jgi:hypothetical protein
MIGRLLFFYVGMDFISVSELSCEKNGRALAGAHRALPADTQRISSAERRRLIDQRATAYAHRYAAAPAVAGLAAH